MKVRSDMEDIRIKGKMVEAIYTKGSEATMMTRAHKKLMDIEGTRDRNIERTPAMVRVPI
jgi:hypothetical protein